MGDVQPREMDRRPLGQWHRDAVSGVLVLDKALGPATEGWLRNRFAPFADLSAFEGCGWECEPPVSGVYGMAQVTGASERQIKRLIAANILPVERDGYRVRTSARELWHLRPTLSKTCSPTSRDPAPIY